MSAFISEITVKSIKKINQTYFKVANSEIFISKMSQNDSIKQNLHFPINQTDRLCLEIWNYQPHKLIHSWKIDASLLINPKNKYKIAQNQWSVVLCIYQGHRGLSQNKQNIRHKAINSLSSLKQIKNQEKPKKHNKSRIKDINLALLQKKKNKAGVKKALKSTIDYIIKHNSHEDYGLIQPQYAKTGKCTPCVEQVSYIKSQSSLYSDYGFNNSEISKRIEEKQLKAIENEQTLDLMLEKKKIKLR